MKNMSKLITAPIQVYVYRLLDCLTFSGYVAYP